MRSLAELEIRFDPDTQDVRKLHVSAPQPQGKGRTGTDRIEKLPDPKSSGPKQVPSKKGRERKRKEGKGTEGGRGKESFRISDSHSPTRNDPISGYAVTS